MPDSATCAGKRLRYNKREIYRTRIPPFSSLIGGENVTDYVDYRVESLEKKIRK